MEETRRDSTPHSDSAPPSRARHSARRARSAHASHSTHPAHSAHSAPIGGRMDYIDAAKGLAIILVVMGHVLRANTDTISLEVDDLLAGLIYAFHMPLFFFVTGYCRYLSEQKRMLTLPTLGQQCEKLTRRLLSAYLLWTLIYYLLRLITTPGEPATWLTITLTFRGVAPLWFLADLLLAELVFLVIQWAAKGRWLVHAIGALVTGILTTPLFLLLQSVNELDRAMTALQTAENKLLFARAKLPYIAMAEVYNPLDHLKSYLAITGIRLLPTLFFLFTGYLAAKLLAHRQLSNVVHVLIGGVALEITVVTQLLSGNLVNLHLCVITYPQLFLLTGLLGGLGALELCRGLNGILPLWILRFLGKRTLGIMVVHYPPLPTIEVAGLWCLMLNPNLEFTAGLLLAQTAIAVALSAFATVLIEKKLYL